MSDTDSGRPRRAFEPLDGNDSNDAQDETDAPSPPSRAWTAAEADAPGSGDGAGDLEVSTPIPPPAPTLPEPLQPPEAGRRFSAEPVADDTRFAAPRRSAASVSSPPPPDGAESAAAPLGDGDQPSGAELDAAVVRPDGAEGNPRRRLWTIIGAAVAAVLVLGLIVWFALGQRAGTGAPPASSAGGSVVPSSPSPSPVLDESQLLTAAELSGLRKGATWTQADPPTGPNAQPACVELSSLGGVSPEIETSRYFTASQSAGTLIQTALSLADVQASGTAYSALVDQVAACAGAQIVAAYRNDGLADAATTIVARLSDGSAHTLLLARTGTFVNIADTSVKGAAPTGVNALAATLTTSLARQCSAATGTCPAKPKASVTPPPPTETIGWLAWVDLPQITAGSGTWTATDPQAPNLVGSQCEDVDLNKMPGAKQSLHRTYLLTDDPKAPEGFGIDEVLYSYPKASDATSMVKTLKKNFKDCGDRTRTATVTAGAVTVLDADGDQLGGTTYVVTQRISDSKTVSFRVGIAAVGTRLVYLLANPASNFDFTDSSWDAVVGRATQRATQFA